MAYKILFFLFIKKAGINLKDIGMKLKETRESMGISIEEAAEDLKVKVNQVENIEEGNMDAFKDIFFLKYFIRDYSKYLGLNYEEMVDDFNEYLFDYTSKISLEDIKQAKLKEKKEKKENRIMSPYTVEPKKTGISLPLTLGIVLFVCILTVIILLNII